ncbi:hypothetical protein OKW43_007733 [Paraburkholderia sp. WC7.3g]
MPTNDLTRVRAKRATAMRLVAGRLHVIITEVRVHALRCVAVIILAQAQYAQCVISRKPIRLQ